MRCHRLKVKCDHCLEGDDDGTGNDADNDADNDAGDDANGGADKSPKKSAGKKRKAPTAEEEDGDEGPRTSDSQRARKRVYRKQTQVEGGSDVDDLERSTRGLSIDTAAAGVNGEGEGRRTVSLSPSLSCGSAR